jgi:hypothetical protein
MAIAEEAEDLKLGVQIMAGHLASGRYTEIGEYHSRVVDDALNLLQELKEELKRDAIPERISTSDQEKHTYVFTIDRKPKKGDQGKITSP